MQWDKVSRRLIKQCCIRGTQDISRASETEYTVALGTPNMARDGFSGFEASAFPQLWLHFIAGYVKHVFGLEKELCFFSIYQDLRKSLS